MGVCGGLEAIGEGMGGVLWGWGGSYGGLERVWGSPMGVLWGPPPHLCVPPHTLGSHPAPLGPPPHLWVPPHPYGSHPTDSSLLSPELQRIFHRVQRGADFMPGWQTAVRHQHTLGAQKPPFGVENPHLGSKNPHLGSKKTPFGV